MEDMYYPIHVMRDTLFVPRHIGLSSYIQGSVMVNRELGCLCASEVCIHSDDKSCPRNIYRPQQSASYTPSVLNDSFTIGSH